MRQFRPNREADIVIVKGMIGSLALKVSDHLLENVLRMKNSTLKEVYSDWRSSQL